MWEDFAVILSNGCIILTDFLQSFISNCIDSMITLENTGNHSGVLTQERCINLADADLLMAPRKKKSSPKI